MINTLVHGQGPAVESKPATARVTPWVVLVASSFSPSLGHCETVFEEATEKAGVDAPHEFVYLITGQAWGDIDRDGCTDLYLTRSDGPNQLYRNNCDGSFTLLDASYGLALPDQVSGGATFADFDNDGWLDLYVAANGSNALLKNLGTAGPGFEDVSEAAGVADANGATSVAWADFDSDSYLDLYVANYFRVSDVLYRNRGDGTFEDMTSLLDSSALDAGAFAVRWLDYDNDGDQDIYVVNDRLAGNRLWRNDGRGCDYWCFTEVSVQTGSDRPVDGMGISVADYDRDGDLDLYFSSSNELVLLQNQTAQGSDFFIDVSTDAGVTVEAVGWGSTFFDVDNDGWLDIYAATSSPESDRSNRLYRNLGDGSFEDISFASGADDPGFSMGVAACDYDRDGGVDLVVGNLHSRYEVYRNARTAGPSNRSLLVRLEGSGPINRSAVGARVEVHFADGTSQMQDVRSGNSLGSGNDLALHFGLGAADKVDLSIRWPNGSVESFSDVPADSIVYERFGELFSSDFETGTVEDWQ